MGISEKLENAKKTDWVSDSFSATELKTIVELAKISALIERERLEMGMTQKEFAEYMGVSQGMVSKWESREYNFTIKTLNDICDKLNLDLYVNLEKTCAKTDYTIARWNSEVVAPKREKIEWTSYPHNKEAIA